MPVSHLSRRSAQDVTPATRRAPPIHAATRVTSGGGQSRTATDRRLDVLRQGGAGTVRTLLVCATVLAACDRPQPAVAAAEPPAALDAMLAVNAPVYMCPMDRDIRSHEPGACPRCGMKLVTSVPEPVAYHLDLQVSAIPRPNIPLRLAFAVFDPWKGNPVTRFSVVHEKLFHGFIVSRDLQYFRHYHPSWQDGVFEYELTLPRPGMYRVLGDFYPEASTPQLAVQTLFVAGEEPPVEPLARDYSPKQADNMTVQLATTPAEPVVGVPTQLRFTVGPADGLEKYLGTWAHMLSASEDLIDLIHSHPSIADGGPQVLFSLVFPRARTYRVWVQVQRNGVVNTAHFDIPVRELPEGPIHVGSPEGS
jgi:hypothetical protein